MKKFEIREKNQLSKAKTMLPQQQTQKQKKKKDQLQIVKLINK